MINLKIRRPSRINTKDFDRFKNISFPLTSKLDVAIRGMDRNIPTIKDSMAYII
jgi:hypothetical protein